MTTGSAGRRDDGRQGRMPKNRARLLIVLAVVVILVVVFGYLLIVSQAGSN
jgi:t-SNARE complex subunit (syntaxin)